MVLRDTSQVWCVRAVCDARLWKEGIGPEFLTFLVNCSKIKPQYVPCANAMESYRL